VEILGLIIPFAASAGYMLDAGDWASSFFQGLVRGTLGGHMVYGIIMGFFLSQARFAAGAARVRNIALAMLVPVTLHTAWNAALTYGGDILDGNFLAGMLTWGLSTGLWLLAFSYIRINRDASSWGPQARTLQMAPVLCHHCHGPYPVGATYCQRCGARVGGTPN